MRKLFRKIGRKYKRPRKDKSFVLIVTHGRSGSTLLQGILNRAPGWYIHGENANLLYHQYQELLAVRKIKKHQRFGSFDPPETSPWFGYENLNALKFYRQIRKRMRSFLTDHAPADATVVGFKEIRYLQAFLKDPNSLQDYLDFLLETLKPCKLVMLTRDPSATSNSGWWAHQDQAEVVSNLQAYGRFLIDYADNHSDHAIHVSYEDVVNQTDAFWNMLSFVCAGIDEAQVADALSQPHSYRPKTTRPFAVPNLPAKKGHSPLLVRANEEWAKGNSSSARTLYQAYYDATEPEEGRKVLPAYVFRRLNMKCWPTMTVAAPKIAYFNIPKCGCTSVGHLLFSVERPDASRPKGIHGYFKGAMHEDSIEHLKDHFKFTVVRDPVKRFVSCFRNRVLHHGDLAPLVDTNIIPRQPDINEFALQLKFFADQSLALEHHVLSQSWFLNGDLTAVDRVYPIEEIAQIATDVSQLAGRKLDMPHEQIGGPDIGLGELSEEAFEHILKYYAEDYALLQDFYSEEAIRAEYKAAREAKLSAERT